MSSNSEKQSDMPFVNDSKSQINVKNGENDEFVEFTVMTVTGKEVWKRRVKGSTNIDNGLNFKKMN